MVKQMLMLSMLVALKKIFLMIPTRLLLTCINGETITLDPGGEKWTFLARYIKWLTYLTNEYQIFNVTMIYEPMTITICNKNVINVSNGNNINGNDNNIMCVQINSSVHVENHCHKLGCYEFALLNIDNLIN